MTRIVTSAIPPVHAGVLPIMVLVSQPSLPRHFAPAEMAVSWLRSAQYRIVLDHHDVHVDCLSTYCDVTGLLHSLESSIHAAAAAATRFRITPDSTLRARLLVDVHDEPLRPAEGMKSSGAVSHWRSIEMSEDVYYRTEDMGTAWLSGTHEYRFANPLERVALRALFEDHEVWSSHSSAEDQAAQAENLRTLVAAPFER